MPIHTHSFGLRSAPVDLAGAGPVSISLGGQPLAVPLQGSVSVWASFGVSLGVVRTAEVWAWSPPLGAPPRFARFDDDHGDTPGYWTPTPLPDPYGDPPPGATWTACERLTIAPAVDAPQVPQPGGYPQVTAAAGVSGLGGVAVDVGAMARALLESGRDPVAYWSALTQAPSLVAAALEDAVLAALDGLAPGPAALEAWWAYELLGTLQAGFQEGLDAARADAAARALEALGALPSFVQPLREALVALAKDVVARLDGALQLALDLLLLAGQPLTGLSPLGLYSWLVDVLLDALATSWDDAPRRQWLLDRLEDCVARVGELLPQGAAAAGGALVVSVVAALGAPLTPARLLESLLCRVALVVADRPATWAQGKARLASLLQAAFAALEGSMLAPPAMAVSLANALGAAFRAASAPAAPRRGGGAPPGPARATGWDPRRALADLALWLGDAAAGGHALLGQLCAALLDGLQASPATLGALLEALCDALAARAALTREQVVQLVNALGAWKAQAVEWLVAHWERFRACVLEAAWAQVLQLLQAILGTFSGWLQEALDDLTALGRVVGWLVELPQVLLEAPQLAQAQAHLAQAAAIAREGPGRWLNRVAAGQDLAAFLRGALQGANPLMSWVERLSGALTDALAAARAAAGQAAVQLTGQGLELMGQLEQAVAQLRAVEETLWRVLFQGQGDQTPWVAVVRAEGVVSDPLEVEDGQVTGLELVPPLPGSFQDAAQVLEALTDEQFLALELRRGERLRVPHPTDTTRLDWERLPPPPGGCEEVTLPLPLPVPFGDASVAIARLPELWVIDMRYHLPYGPKVGCLRVADLDHDGFVRAWEVDAVQAALAAGTSSPELDCDGDGVVTADDLQLAIEQRTRYVNGLMYRPTTAPLGFWCSTSPYDWAFVALTSLEEESLPGKLTRRGILGVVDGQVVVPLPSPPPPESPLAPGLSGYPLRYHLESRTFVDLFDGLSLGDYGHGLPGLPLVSSPGVRNDLVLRGGEHGTDWQVHVASQPLNPLLRTWRLRLDLYFKAILAYVVSVRGDLRVQVVYETDAPLIEVIEQWHERFSALAADPPAPPDGLSVPVPWQMFKDAFEATNVPRFARAAIGAVGPFADLLLDWTDERHLLRASLGYLRQGLLGKWEPAPTWAQLRLEVSGWAEAEVGGPLAREAVLQALEEARAELGLGDEDPVYVPRRIARLARARVRSALEAQAGAAALPAATVRGVAVSGAGRGAPRRGARLAPARAGRPTRAGRPAAPAPAPLDAAAALRLAEARIDATFEEDVGRFAAGLDQLVSDLDRAGAFAIPGCGAGFTLRAPFMLAWPLPAADTLSAAQGDTDVVVDAALSARGNPFHKPIYHAVLELGEDARLFTAPREGGSLFIGPAGKGTRAVVEGSRVLEDAAGGWWLWVRLQDWTHGWLRLHESVWRPMFSPQQVAADVVEDLVREVVDPELLAGLEVLAGRRAVTRLEASPPETVDETRHAPLARRALARLSAQPAAPREDDLALRECYHRTLEELRVRVFGRLAVDDPQVDTGDAALAEVFNQLSVAKREKLWAHTGAWLKCAFYFPRVGELVVNTLVPRLMQDDFRGAWDALMEAAERCADFTLDEALLAAQSAAPYVLELVETLLDTGKKLRRVKDLVTGAREQAEQGELSAAGSGRLPALDFWAQQPVGPDWSDLPGMLLRLLIDDQEEPGRPAPEVPAGGDPRHDWGITFRYDVQVKDVDTGEVQAGVRTLHLAEPAVAGIAATRSQVEPGVPITLFVTTWGAVVHDGAARKLVRGIDGSRIAPETQAQVQWRLRPPGGQGWSAPLPARGPRVELTLDDPAVAAPGVTFEAYLGRPCSELEVEAGLEPAQVVFPGQVAPVRYVVTADGPTGTATLADRDGATLAEYELATTRGAHSLPVDLSALGDLALERSPLRVCFPPTVKVSARPAPDDAGPPHVGGKDVSGEVVLDLGHDSLTITWSTEAGGGVGAGAQVGAGAGVAPTLNVKKFWLQPRFNLDLLTDRPAVGRLLQLCVKTSYHAVEALHLAVAWAEEYARRRPDDWIVRYLGFPFWWQVFSAYAVKDALYEMAGEHAAWVAQVLERVGWVFELEASANFDAAAYVSFEAGAVVTGRAFIPLSTLLAPVIEVLCGADPAPPEEGAGLADRIVPMIKATFEDCVKVKVGALPVAVEVETRGKLAEASFSIPPGSPLMARLEELGRALAESALAFKRRAFASPPRPVDDVAGFRLARTLLRQLDRQVKALVIQGSVAESWRAASPLVGLIMSHLTGAPHDPARPPEVTAAGQAVLDMLAAAALRGVQVEPGVPLHDAPNELEPGDGLARVWLHLDDGERARMHAAGFQPPSEVEELETQVFELALGRAPRAIGWNHHDAGEGQVVAGLVAAFDTDGEAAAFAATRGASVAPAVAGATWRREGRSWTWIETDLAPALGGRGVPLPDVELAGDRVRLTFDELPVGTVGAEAAPPLAAAARVARTGIWRVVLLERANPEEVRRVRRAVLERQEAWFPADGAPPASDGAPGAPRGGHAGARPWREGGQPGKAAARGPARAREQVAEQRRTIARQAEALADKDARLAAVERGQRRTAGARAARPGGAR